MSYSGLTWGRNAEIEVTRITGISPPDVRVDTVDKAEDHGAFVFARFLGPRAIMVEGNIVPADASTITLLEDSMRLAFRPRKDPDEFELKLPGWSSSRIANCVPTKFAYDIDSLYNLGKAAYAVQFIAEDPRLYDSNLLEVSFAPVGAITIGVDFPIDFPFTFGGGSSGSVTIGNAGTFQTPPFVRIDGPATNPRIQNVTTGEELKVGMTIPAGEYLEIDFAAKTIMLDGSASRYGYLTAESVWWSLQPGANQISFFCDGQNEATQVSISWRSAWN